jgi:hypothetical protein
MPMAGVITGCNGGALWSTVSEVPLDELVGREMMPVEVGDSVGLALVDKTVDAELDVPTVEED